MSIWITNLSNVKEHYLTFYQQLNVDLIPPSVEDSDEKREVLNNAISSLYSTNATAQSETMKHFLFGRHHKSNKSQWFAKLIIEYNILVIYKRPPIRYSIVAPYKIHCLWQVCGFLGKSVGPIFFMCFLYKVFYSTGCHSSSPENGHTITLEIHKTIYRAENCLDAKWWRRSSLFTVVATVTESVFFYESLIAICVVNIVDFKKYTLCARVFFI